MTAVLGKDLVGLEHLSADQIRLVLDTAEPFKEVSERPIKKVPALRGKTIVNLFFEASTRTRISFEFAEKRLSADTVNVAASGSSVQKGETLVDTARNLEAMRIDMVVIRHPSSGAAEFLGNRIRSNVINAGDGKHEHPTQGLLDLLTIRDKHGRIEGIKVCLVGDVLHSRVARSNIWGLVKLERATRECRTSHTRHTLMPSILPCLSRMVRRSSRPCVGCSCLPSPALMTLERIRLPRNSAAPEEGWRMTTMSIRIASRFRAVSTRVSPFCTELPLAATLTVSAERRFSANSNEIRVRVDASKNRLTMVLPRSAGTFLMGRSETSLKGSAVSRMSRIWSAERSSSPTRSLPRGSAVMSALPDAPGPPRRVRPAPRPARRPAPRCSP